MSEKRFVHEILSERRTDPNTKRSVEIRPVALIQHGNREDGFQLEFICPWCGFTIAYAHEHLVRGVIGGKYRCGITAMKQHWPRCSMYGKIEQAGGEINDAQMSVELTDKLLGTEKPLDLTQFGVTDGSSVH